MTVENVQSSLVPCFVVVMRLMGMESIVDHMDALKISLSSFPPFTRLCCGIGNMCSMDHKSQAGCRMTKLLCYSLFIVVVMIFPDDC